MFYRVLLWRHRGKQTKHLFQQGSFFGRRLQGGLPRFWAPPSFYLLVSPPLACFPDLFIYIFKKYFGYACWNEVLLRSTGCPGTCYVAYLAGLNPHCQGLTASSGLGSSQVCSHHTWILLLFPWRAQRCGRVLTLSTLLFQSVLFQPQWQGPLKHTIIQLPITKRDVYLVDEE